jgi:predicted sugar kinase
MKSDFKPFPVGTVFNPVNKLIHKPELKYRKITILYPSRLNAMALDPGKITSNKNMVFTAGEVVFTTSIFKKVNISITGGEDEIVISERSPRQILIKHAVKLMQKALEQTHSLEIDVEDPNKIDHIGLGSSSGLIACVACAINELYGKPIDKADLLQYLAQNHGEEIQNDSLHLMPVQCLGGSAATGLYEGGLIIIAGKNRVISTMTIDENYKIVIGIPNDFVPRDSSALLNEEIKVFDSIVDCSKKYSKEVAYRMIHEFLPAMEEHDLKTIGNLIYDYRFKMGSVEFCSYTYKKLPELARKLKIVKDRFAEIFSISSVGPSFFAITKHPDETKERFLKNGLRVVATDVSNTGYKVVLKK